MGATATWQLPYPEEVDPADVPVDMKELADRLEVVLSQVKSGGAIPGEVRMWSGAALPAATFGHWVWADGTAYSAATYPLASGNIAAAWKTHAGKADPGAGQFRVPDLRGSAPIGLDAMPGGARANRIARAAAATLAAVSGEEVHALAVAEMAAHNHGVTDPGHAHGVSDPGHVHSLGASSVTSGGGVAGAAYPYTSVTFWTWQGGGVENKGTGIGISAAATGISTGQSGGGGAHENLPPTTFVPFIVKLDD